MKKIIINKDFGIIDCSLMKPHECSDMILQKLEPFLGVKLESINKSSVNGSLAIDHGYGHFEGDKYIPTDIIERGHTITVNIYESDNEFLSSTPIKRPAKIPQQKDVEDLIP